MRHQHAGLAIPDFPAAYGKIWPAMDEVSVARYNQLRVEATALKPITAFQIALQMGHRLIALLILAAVTAIVWKTKQRFGWASLLTKTSMLWLGLILVQAALGAATIWTDKSADIATGHVAVGALSLVTGTMLSLAGLRCLRKPPSPVELAVREAAVPTSVNVPA